MSELNRRNFLKGAVAATASLAAAAALGGCSQTASSAAAGSAAASSTAASEAAQTTAEGPYLQYDICGKLSMSEFEASAAVAEPIEKFDAEENYDVVVIGAGASGMPAAIAAYEGGGEGLRQAVHVHRLLHRSHQLPGRVLQRKVHHLFQDPGGPAD